MTREDIKATYDMNYIVESYGFKPNRAGFISCPFHKGDRDASMKIYKDSFHCFGCGSSGDIFTFVQKIDNCDFKTAFLSLGGEYEKPSFQSNLAVYRAVKEKEKRERIRLSNKQKRNLNNMLIDIYRSWYLLSEPFSEVWCDCYNKLQYQLYLHEILNEKR